MAQKPHLSSKEKQILRQKEVTKVQQQTKDNTEPDDLPQALPAADKFIFGLGTGNQGSQSNDEWPDTEDTDDISDTHNTQLDGINVQHSRYEPMDYSKVWDTREFIETSSGGKFCCYSAGTQHSDLVFVCLHGCGHGALSYSLIASVIKEKYQIFAFDYRGHGDTTFGGDDSKSNDTTVSSSPFKKLKASDLSVDYQMSKKNLVRDIIEIVSSKYGKEDPPPIVLVGHSLGGALAVHTAHVQGMDGLPSLVGIVVIDVVEGTALNSLIHMRSIINARPKSFDTLQSAIRWCVTSGMIRNFKSARLSVPPMFIQAQANGSYAWRTNVLLTEPFWRDWFVGLSELFLKAPVSKMLMLADTDRLDKPLTIGQMQGKYQLCIVGGGVGHTLHEDAPKKVAEKLLEYAERNQFVKLWQINKKFKLKKATK